MALVLHVIHQPNSGAYQARLNALKQVDTPYFGFVDADDMVDPKMYEKMLLFAERERLDVVQCGYEESGRAINSEGDVVVLEGRDEVYKKYIYPKLIDIKESSFIWDKIYRNQYDFASFDKTDNVTDFDDMIFNLYFFCQCRGWVFCASRFTSMQQLSAARFIVLTKKRSTTFERRGASEE